VPPILTRSKTPSRRRVLRILGLALVGAPALVKLGAVLDVRVKKVAPQDVAPVPWIGHC
jgi:hypothetical protein